LQLAGTLAFIYRLEYTSNVRHFSTTTQPESDMDSFYHVLQLLHVLGFVFMSIPLFNLIVVNERVQLGGPFIYHADRYMENIIRRGAGRCYAFQTTVLVSGVCLLVFGPLGIAALWTNWVVMVKTLLLLTLMALLSVVHFRLQPAIERLLADVTAESTDTEDLPAQLKPYRVARKRLATLCLFLVMTAIILGLQVYSRFSSALTVILIALAGLFAFRVNKTLVRFGWI
jgi:hypothetical protein